MSRDPSRRPSRTILAAVGLTTVAATAVAVVVPTAGALVPSSTTSRDHRVVATRPAWVAKAKAVGTPAAATRHHLTIALSTDQAGAAAYAKSVSDSKSPNYRKFLTPAQYAKKFGASQAEISAATKWLTGQGFTVGKVDSGHTMLTVSGPTTSVNKAFGVGLKTFTHEKSTVTAPTAAATVPATVSSIKYVVGLDTTPRYHADSISGNSCSHYWGEQVPPYQEPNNAPFTTPLPTAMCGYTPKALNKAQKVDKVKQTGKGVTVGITMWCDAPTLTEDLNRWSGQMGVPKLKDGQATISRGSDPYSDYCDTNLDGRQSYAEVALDADAIHGAAPDAKII